jgi:hypothetical protein
MRASGPSSVDPIEVFTAEQRPDLWERSRTLFGTVWPEYNMHGNHTGKISARSTRSTRISRFSCTTRAGIASSAGEERSRFDGMAPLKFFPQASMRWGSARSMIPSRPVPFDPWLRVHVRLGATILRTETRSLQIEAPASDCEEWTGMTFPEDGDYVFPAGPAPVSVQDGVGSYWEPNIWVLHHV